MRIVANENIRSNDVMCIDQENASLGIMSLSKAIKLAREVNLDLVQISFSKESKIPICKIVDYGKYKYNLSKELKRKEKQRRESAIVMKEIQFTPNISKNDLETKTKHIVRFLNDDNHVKIRFVLTGREAYSNKSEFIKDKFEEIINIIKENNINFKFIKELSINNKNSRDVFAIIGKM